MSTTDKTRNKLVAILTTDGFEEIELTAPKQELENFGVTVHIASNKENVKSWKEGNWGNDFPVNVSLDNLKADDYDALIIPGGVINADRLRRDKRAIEIIREFDKKQKLIAAICHGPQLLIEADLVKGKNMTSHSAVKTDMKNAGAIYGDHGVATDGNYITAQGVDDIPSFIKEITGVLELS
jgi:protease I